MPSGIQRFGAEALVDGLLNALAADGAVAVEGVIEPSLLARIDAELAPWLDQQRAACSLSETRRVGALLARSACLPALLESPLLHLVCEHFLLPACSAYRLSAIHLIEQPPGVPRGGLHRDDVIWPLPGPRPLAVINFLIPITTFTAANGGTVVALGSHRWPRDTTKMGPGRLDLDVTAPVEEVQLVATELEPGGMLPVLGGVVHATGANLTTEPRRALSISVNLGWLRQEENIYLTTPAEVVAGLSPRVRDLLGYRLHDPYLGHTGFD